MINVAKYEVLLYLDGRLVGDIREHAQKLSWKRQRTRMGVDSISFTLNDIEFARWCQVRSTTITELLKPLALTCRMVRNGIPLIGGFLATMPSYQPKGGTANLAMKFDGYINYLAKVHLTPGNSWRDRMGAVVKDWVDYAEKTAELAGKSFGFTAGMIDQLATVEYSTENYKDIKGAISDRCDNTTGAGPFEFYVHSDMTYDVVKDSNFGKEITDYIIEYPMVNNTVSATKIQAKEVTGFASMVMGVGAGQIQPNGSTSGAIYSAKLNREAVKEYGYAEEVLQQSSVSNINTLENNVEAELASVSNMQWQPQINLSGKTVSPSPTGERRIWIGDTITIQNNQDLTGMTSGKFRVNALEVKVKATGAEEIIPTLSSSDNINTSSFAKDWVRMQNELLNLKTGTN